MKVQRINKMLADAQDFLIEGIITQHCFNRIREKLLEIAQECHPYYNYDDELNKIYRMTADDIWRMKGCEYRELLKSISTTTST